VSARTTNNHARQSHYGLTGLPYKEDISMNTTDVPENRPANLVPITRAVQDDEPPVPESVRRRARQELSGDASHEWLPLYRFEVLEGRLIKRTPMTKGGTAYVFDDVSVAENGALGTEHPDRVLLKKGGTILCDRLANVPLGARLWIRYQGELDAKSGQSPARDWYVILLQE